MCELQQDVQKTFKFFLMYIQNIKKKEKKPNTKYFYYIIKSKEEKKETC